MSGSEYAALLAEGKKALSYGLNDYADPYTLVADLVTALESLVPRTVTTVEELDALPDGTVYMYGDNPFGHGVGVIYSDYDSQAEHVLPATVLFSPPSTEGTK